ncbi:hypothetical protein OEIGOIKO_01432 [Streptomyces chrestomyceticus JCM 4735]|uniref:Uncharacterized protein n=1 Tax=Streptomyces chrestomyceticus JCM 4735 TaxID=1306181 RepID=A0A7U9KQY9_9ACTN|nr:hypothetical protein [Streptomyces chrestomyceticus]GCD33709.1 hypothetical protein OEIGOIKO_01432 [Streptomyces chrestomyceticus JCM 4735]
MVRAQRGIGFPFADTVVHACDVARPLGTAGTFPAEILTPALDQILALLGHSPAWPDGDRPHGDRPHGNRRRGDRPYRDRPDAA